jgi:hypothetical protein
MLLQDGKGEPRGLINTISEENLRNPIDPIKRWQREVEEMMPGI